MAQGNYEIRRKQKKDYPLQSVHCPVSGEQGAGLKEDGQRVPVFQRKPGGAGFVVEASPAAFKYPGFYGALAEGRVLEAGHTIQGGRMGNL